MKGGPLESIIKLLRKLAEIKFWGEILLKWEAGKIVHIKKTENIKPE